MVRQDFCAVDHLLTAVTAATVVQGFDHQLPQARQRPVTALEVKRRPFPEMLVQVAPCSAGPDNPENTIRDKP